MAMLLGSQLIGNETVDLSKYDRVFSAGFGIDRIAHLGGLSWHMGCQVGAGGFDPIALRALRDRLSESVCKQTFILCECFLGSFARDRVAKMLEQHGECDFGLHAHSVVFNIRIASRVDVLCQADDLSICERLKTQPTSN